MPMQIYNCKHYDSENGWCKKFSNWNDPMPDIEYCCMGPCPYKETNDNIVSIRTKYNIGDVIFHAEYCCDTYTPTPSPGRIYKIEAEITKENTRISYYVVVEHAGAKIYESYLEDSCFDSYEKCLMWCKTKNKKIV